MMIAKSTVIIKVTLNVKASVTVSTKESIYN